VTERVGGAESARRDPESEAIISEALLAASGDLGIEVVRKGTLDEIIERDFESLVQRGFDENAQVFSNLLKAGVDWLALGEVGASEMGRELAGGKVVVERVHVHAGIQMVRTDTAAVTAAGNADADEKALRDAKTRALREAASRMVDAMKAQGKGPAPLTVTITVDGLREFDQADRISKGIRGVPGVIWSRDLRWAAGSPGSSSGVARLEMAWAGTPDDLRARIGALDAGVRLEPTKIEGARWNYRAVEAAPAPAPVPPPPPPAPAKPPAEAK
jgi:hypothetical protein